jgi:hypothetical protein
MSLTSNGRLTADDARELMNIKKEGFDKTQSIIRHMCDIMIKDASRRGQRDMAFDVPISVWGRESYDRREMGHALAEQLYGDGFDVTGHAAGLIIRWGPEQNPRHPPTRPAFPPLPPYMNGIIARHGIDAHVRGRRDRPMIMPTVDANGMQRRKKVEKIINIAL